MRRTQDDIDGLSDYMQYIDRLESGLHCKRLLVADIIIGILSVSVIVIAIKMT